MSVRPVPTGFNTLSAYLIVPDVAKAMQFYAAAFGAEGGVCMSGPTPGSIMHAEMTIGDSTFMLSGESAQWGTKSPLTLSGTPVGLHLYVDDCDAAFARAEKAGCTVMFPLMDAFWGDRYGKLKDPFGHEWGIATHKEDVAPDEMERRAAEWFKANC